MAKDYKIKVTADTTQAQKSIKSLDGQVDKTSGSIAGMRTSLASLASPTRIAAVGFAALAAGVTVSVKAFAEFEDEMLGVKTLLDAGSFGAKGLERGFAEMKGEVLALNKTVPSTLSSINKALFDTVSAGVAAGDAVKFVGVSARLAVAGLTDVAIATDGMTSAMNAYGFEAGEADLVASKFFAAQKKGKTTIAELSNGFGVVGSSAAAMGVEFNDLLSAVSAVTLAGVKTSSAYAGLKAVLSNVAKPTVEAAIEAKRLGIEFNAASLRAKGLNKFMKDLATNNKFTKDSITRLFGSVEAQNIAFALTAEGAAKYSDILKDVSDDTKTASDLTSAHATQIASTKNQTKLLTKEFDTLSIKIGERLAPALNEVLGAINTMGRGVKGIVDLIADSFVKDEDTFGSLRDGMREAKDELVDLNEKLISLKNNKENLESRGVGTGLIDENIAKTEELIEVENNRIIAAEAGIKHLRTVRGDFDKTEGKAVDGTDPAKIAAEQAAESARLLAETEESARVDKFKKEQELYTNLETLKADFEARKALLEQQRRDGAIEGDVAELAALKLKEEEKSLIKFETQVTDLSNADKHAQAIVKIQDKAAKDELKIAEGALTAKTKLQDMETANKFKAAELAVAILGRESKAGFLIAQTVAAAHVLVEDSKARAAATASAAQAGPYAYAGVLAAMNAAISVSTALSLGTIAAQTVQGLNLGGLIEGNNQQGIDTIPARLTPGEVVVPAATSFADIVDAGRAIGTGESDVDNDSGINITLGFTDNAMELIEAEILGRRSIGIGAI